MKTKKNKSRIIHNFIISTAFLGLLLSAAINISCSKKTEPKKVEPVAEKKSTKTEKPVLPPITSEYKPELRRSIEFSRSSSPKGTPLLVLRDLEGLTLESIVLTPLGAVIVSYFTGEDTIARISERATAKTKREISEAVVLDLAKKIDASYMLLNKRYEEKLKEVTDEFEKLPSRPAAFQGSAYPAEKEALIAFLSGAEIDGREKAGVNFKKASKLKGELKALIAPHIDLKRGAQTYGAAYGWLKDHLPKGEILFVVLGVAHNGSDFPMTLLDKDFETPLGPVKTDREAVKFLKNRLGEKCTKNKLVHRSEHSAEFQMVWLKYIMGEREDWKVVPALTESIQALLMAGQNPDNDESWKKTADALSALEKSRKNIIFVMGVDFAHVGARFDDPPFKNTDAPMLKKKDTKFINTVLHSDTAALISDIKPDFAKRKYCGLGVCYLMSRVLGKTNGVLLDYGVDLDKDSLVSFAGAVIYEK